MTTIASIPCPHCNETVEHDVTLAGQTGNCPSCRKSFRMPNTELSLLTQIRDNIFAIRVALTVLTLVVVVWLLAHW